MGRVEDKEPPREEENGPCVGFLSGDETADRLEDGGTGGIKKLGLVQGSFQGCLGKRLVQGVGRCAFNGQRPGRGHSNRPSRPRLVIISASLHGSVCPSLPSWWTRQEPPAAVAADWTALRPRPADWASENNGGRGGFFFWRGRGRGRTSDGGSKAAPRRHDGRQGGLAASRQGVRFSTGPRSAPMAPMSVISMSTFNGSSGNTNNGIVMSVLSQPLCRTSHQMYYPNRDILVLKFQHGLVEDSSF